MAEQASAWQQIPRRKPRLSFMSLILGYFDEAGCPGVLPSATSNVQPILSIITVTAPAPSVQSITREYLKLKRRFFRNRLAKSTFLDSLLLEIKGGDLRTDIRMGNSRVIRHHMSNQSADPLPVIDPLGHKNATYMFY